MKILYKQTQAAPLFHSAGVENCCLKQIDMSRDRKLTSRKDHYHGGFEVHFMETGCQTYHADHKDHRVEAGMMLLIPPGVRHRVADLGPDAVKFSITFDAEADSPFLDIREIMLAGTEPQIRENLAAICREKKKPGVFSPDIIQGRLFETLIWILRQCGAEKPLASLPEPAGEDIRLSLAKQYIRDNIESDLRVPDVAAYCHLSTKQLTRLFQNGSADSPLAYIQRQRTARIQWLLTGTELSLSQISERMHFSSEHYFNAFFKKHAGMTPGSYRKMAR